MLFKFYFKRTRSVQQSVDHGGEKPYTWMQEQVAYSKDAVFFDLQKAKDYAQRHSATPLTWEHAVGWEFHSATVGDMEFMITQEDWEVEPTELLAMPENFRSTERDPD